LENIYSDKYFLVKVHRPTGTTKGKGAKQAMLVHDAGKSFALYFSKAENGRVFENAMKALDGNVDKMAMYRWAKRVGDWEWKICLGCVPEVRPTW
jgi:hypothetical protein